MWNAELGLFVEKDNMDRESRFSGQAQQHYQQGSNAGQNWDQSSIGRPSNNQDQMARGFQYTRGSGQDQGQPSQHCGGRGQQGHDGRGQYLHGNNRSQDQGQQSHYDDDSVQQVDNGRGQGHDVRGQGHTYRRQGHNGRGQGHTNRGQGHNGRGQGHDERGQSYDGRGQDQFGEMSGSNRRSDNQGDGLLPDPILQPLMPFQSQAQMAPTFAQSPTCCYMQSPQQKNYTRQPLSRSSFVSSLNTEGVNNITGNMNRCRSTASINSEGSNNSNSRQTVGNRKQRRCKELKMTTHLNNTDESEGPGNMARSFSVRNIDDNQDLGARSKQFTDLQKNSNDDIDNQPCLTSRGRGRGRGGSMGRGQHSEINHYHRGGVGIELKGSSRGRTINSGIRPDNSSQTMHEPVMGSASRPVVYRGMNNRKHGRSALAGARETSGDYVVNEDDNVTENDDDNINVTDNGANQSLFRCRRLFRGIGSRGRIRGHWHGFVGKQYAVNEDASTCSGSSKGDFDEDMSTTSDISRTASSIADDLSEAGVNDVPESRVKDSNGEISLVDISTVRLRTLKNRIMRYNKKLAVMRKKNEDGANIKQFTKQLEEMKRVYGERVQNEDDPNKLMSQNMDTDVRHKQKKRNRPNRNKNNNEVPQEANVDCIRKLISKFDDILADAPNAATDKQSSIPHQQPLKADSKQDAAEKAIQSVTDTRKRNPSKTSCEPDVNEIVKFIVRTFQGKGQPEEIVRESGLFPVDFDAFDWFCKMKDRFNVLERNGIIIAVFVYCKEATYCMDYISKESCSKDECQRYHVCKQMLSGLCAYGEKCRFFHDLLDGRNKKISEKLGFSNVFTNDDICSILKVRFPHICPTWIGNGSCIDPTCIDLHLCPRYVLDQCLEGNACSMIHDTLSEHNKPIIKCFRMEKWNDVIFKRALYMIRQPAVETEETEPIETNAKETDPSDDLVICDLNLTGSCCQNCPNIHSSLHLPYLWQVKFSGFWFTHPMSEDLERAFCDNKHRSDIFVLIHNGILLKVEIIFKPSIVALVDKIDDDGIMQQADVRRLSTPSYVDSSDHSASFSTQWRWYWEDDDRTWNLFEPDTLQHTLEIKFLAKQHDYNYSRNNYQFKYSIDFNAMVQQNIDTRKQRAIKRCPIFVSSNHVENKSFPKSLSPAPVIETPLPVDWVPWDLAHPFELVMLDENSVDYQKVSGSFYKTLDRQQHTIESIFRLQNHNLWSLFCNQEKLMEANFQRIGSKLPLNKPYLFHGTDSLDAVRGICINNFDYRVSGKNGTMYGEGAYFARDAKYSHRYTKPPLRFMFMVPVLVGQYTKGNQTYRRPPNKPGSDHELFDSCVNDVSRPSIYVLSDKNKYYPEFLIHYKNVYEEDIECGIPSSRHTSARAFGHVPSANVSSTNVSGSSAYASGVHTSSRAGGAGVTPYPSHSSQSTQPTVYPGHQLAVYPGYSASSHTGSPTLAQSPMSSASNPYSPSSPSSAPNQYSPQRASSPKQHSTYIASFGRTTPAPQPKKEDSSCCLQ